MSSKLIFLFFTTALVNSGAYCGQRVDLVLYGREIPPSDPFSGDSDPFIKVYYKYDPDQNYIEYGRTSTSDDNPNPDWPQAFSFDYSGGDNQIVKFDLYDEDWMYDDFIGSSELPLGEIVGSALGSSEKVERYFSPGDSGRLLMKVRIDGLVPSVAQPLNPLVALLTKKY